MPSKTWVPELLAVLYFGWMLTLGGCNAESIQRVCDQSFQRSEEASACFVGAMAARDQGNLVDAEKHCKSCYLDLRQCAYIDGGVSQTSDESRADFANRRADLYTACYKGAEGFFEFN